MARRDGLNWSWLGEAARTPPVTLDMYIDIPGDLSRTIEIVDGMVMHCESPTENHQGVQQALVNAIGEAARKLDEWRGSRAIGSSNWCKTTARLSRSSGSG